MDILDRIVAHKKKEIQQRMDIYPVKWLEKQIYFEGKPVSMTEYLRRPDKSGIIAEFKRKSPSKGTINKNASVEKTSIGYMQAGASGLSILTDETFFGGSLNDLQEARRFNFCPILRKDFILDEYQVVEAKAFGADVILLIARMLEKDRIRQLASHAQSLEMEVLLEVHSEEELEKLVAEINMVGVNNRNLQSFETNVDISRALSEKIPSEFLKISESGISDPATLVDLRKYGYEGFLVGERFMMSTQPKRACREFIQSLNKLQKTA
jgi:indole-3-glycerol phosphate synthase